MDPAPEVADALYDLPPEEFVAARDRLAKELRAEGDRESAAAVTKLRRPSVLAWALNQVARDHTDEVVELSRLVGEAARAQAAVLAGGEADLRGAVQRRQEAAQRVLRLAERALSERGSAGHGAELAEAVQVVATDERAGEQLLTGRLGATPTASAPDDLSSLLSASVATAPARGETGSASSGRTRSGRSEQRAGEGERSGDEPSGRLGDDTVDEPDAVVDDAAQEEAQRRRDAMAALASAERAAERADRSLEEAEQSTAEADASTRRAAEELERVAEELRRVEEQHRRAEERLHRAEEVAEQRRRRLEERRERADAANRRLGDARSALEDPSA